MISTAENPWPLITFNPRKEKNGAGGGVRPIGGRLKKTYIFSPWPCVWEGYYLCLAVREAKGLLRHWLTYSGLSFLSPPLMAVFSSLSIIGPIISSSFSLSSSWMISISLTGSTVPSTWMISSSSKAPAATGRKHPKRITENYLFSNNTALHEHLQNKQQNQRSGINDIDFSGSNVKQRLDLAQKIVSLCRESRKNKHPHEKAQWESLENHNKYNKLFRNIFKLSF